MPVPRLWPTTTARSRRANVVTRRSSASALDKPYSGRASWPETPVARSEGGIPPLPSPPSPHPIPLVRAEMHEMHAAHRLERNEVERQITVDDEEVVDFRFGVRAAVVPPVG